MKNITKKIATALLAAIIAASFAACSGSTDDDDSDITETDRTEAGGKKTTDSDGNTDKFDFPTDKSEKGIRITPSEAKKIQTELYECADFSLTIPKGWKVTSGGINIYHSIRVYDPSEPLNQMFILLKADCLLHSQAGKDAWQYNYSMGDQQAALLAAAPVLQNPSTEGFFNIFSQYTDFVTQFEPTYSGYTFPRFDGFTVTERFAAASGMAASLGEELLRADFTDSGKAGEGMFSASVVDFGSTAIAAGMNGYILHGVQCHGGNSREGHVYRMGKRAHRLHENASVFRQLRKQHQSGEQREGCAFTADQPKFQSDDGRDHVLVGKPQQESGHHQSEAKRCNSRI
mgnify:CR=1 FL=1